MQEGYPLPEDDSEEARVFRERSRRKELILTAGGELLTEDGQVQPSSSLTPHLLLLLTPRPYSSSSSLLVLTPPSSSSLLLTPPHFTPPHSSSLHSSYSTLPSPPHFLPKVPNVDDIPLEAFNTNKMFKIRNLNNHSIEVHSSSPLRPAPLFLLLSTPAPLSSLLLTPGGQCAGAAEVEAPGPL